MSELNMFKILLSVFIVNSTATNGYAAENHKNKEQTNSTDVKIVAKYQSKNYQLPEFNSGIEVDGVLDEPQWQNALKIKLELETDPSENTKAPVETTAYLFDDGNTLYIAFEAMDPEPSKIRAHYHDHDQIFDDDTVGIKLDTFNDDLRAYQFFVNALGVKHDSLNDGVTGADDLSWNAVWDADSKITERGFTSEIAIPLNILRFDDSKQEQVWGFELLRFYPRNVFHRLSNVKRDRNISCVLCQLDTFSGMENVETGKNITIVPYITTINSQYKAEPDYATWQDGDKSTEFGGDIRWGITPDSTLSATLNPDFSQVESDVAQLDINETFSLFYPERRQFFVEGAEFYSTLINSVYTRNIGNPDYGIKINHTDSGNNYAAFLANDTATTYILPGNLGSQIASFDEESINGAFRYQHNLEGISSIGTIVTVRDSDSYHNYLAGVDGTYNFTNTEYLRFQYLTSDTKDPLDVVNDYNLDEQNTSGSAYVIDFSHASRDWDLWARMTRVSEGFRADLGFKPSVNYKLFQTGLIRNWYEDSNHWWNEFQLRLVTNKNYDLDGNPLKVDSIIRLDYKGPNQTKAIGKYKIGEEYWNGILYDTNETAAFILTTIVPGVVVELFAGKEDTIDYANSQSAELFTYTLDLSLNLGQHFQTKFSYINQTMDVTQGQLFNTQLIDSRIKYQFDAESFLRLVVQYRDTERDASLYSFTVDEQSKNLGTQLLYSYKINPQTVFFLGYSDSSFENDTFRSFTKADKTLFLKMSYSWSL